MQGMILFIIVVFLWVSALLALKKMNMYFFRFVVGSIGLFTICMIFMLPYLDRAMESTVSFILNIIGEITKYFTVYSELSIVSMDTKNGIVTMMINYECSGIIEMLAYSCLVLFFPFGNSIRRYISAVFGNIYILAANIIRVLSIIIITKTIGAQAFYIAHTLIARILFFTLMIILYYNVFTKIHLRYQNVGEIR